MKFLKIFLITLAVLTTLLVSSYFIVVHNIKSILIHQLTQAKKHQYNLAVTTFDLSLIENRLYVKDLYLTVKDSNVVQNKFELKIKTLELNIESLVSLLFKKKLNVNRLVCEMPDIKIKPNSNKKTGPKKSLNLTQEIGKLFQHIQQTIKDLNVDHFEIVNGGVSLLTTYKKTEPTHITDLNLKVEGFNLNNNKELLSQEVHFYCINQKFYTPDSNIFIAFKKIEINNKDNHFEIDGLYINGHKYDKDSIQYTYSMNTLKIVNIDFNQLYTDNVFKCDSLLIKRPHIKIHLSKNSNTKNNNKILTKIEAYQSNENDLKNLLGNLDIKYIGLTESKIQFTSKTPKNTLSLNSEKATIKINTLLVSEKPTVPIKVDDIYISIKNYNRYSKDSMYHGQFDAIKIKKNSFELINYALTPSIKNNNPNKLWIKSKLLTFNEIEYDQLIYNSIIKAKEIVLEEPFVKFQHNENKSSKNKNPKIKKENILSLLNEKLIVDDLKIIKGNAYVTSSVNNNISEINNINTRVTLEHLEKITNPEVYKDHLDYLYIDAIKHRDSENKLTLKNIQYNKTDNNLHINNIDLVNKNTQLHSKDLNISNFAYIDHTIKAEQISSENLKLDYLIKHHTHQSEKKSSPIPNIEIKEISLKNNQISISDSSFNSALQLSLIQLKGISNTNGTINLDDFIIQGKNLQFKQANTSVYVQSIDLNKKKPSYINICHLKHYHEGDTLLVDVKNINEQLNWDQIIKNKKIDLESIEIKEPKIYYSKNNLKPTEAKKQSKNNIDFKLDTLHLTNACIEYKSSLSKGLHYFSTLNTNLSIYQLQIQKDIQLQKFDLLLNDWKIKPNANTDIISNNKPSHIAIRNFHEDIENTSFDLEDLNIQTDEIKLTNKTNQKNTLLKNLALTIKNQPIQLPIKETFLTELLDNPSLELKHTNTSLETEDGEFFLHRMGFKNHTFSIDSIHYIPKESEIEFNTKQSHQKDYILISTKKIAINQIDFEKLLNKNELMINQINVDGLSLYSYRDKRLSPPPYHYKALPTILINQIKFPFLIKEFNLTNSGLLYKETSDKSLLTGQIQFTDFNARITNITNNKTIDSLRLYATTKLLGKSNLTLHFAQSYKDSLAGFDLKINMGALDMTQLNNATEPLAGIKINTGYLNSLKLHALGNDLYSIGTIKMPYKNLNITISQHSDTTSANALGKVASLLANKLVVKTNNSDEGIIFFERIQNKSIFNFWFKLTMSGIMSSVGVKNSNRVIRHYKHYLKKNNLSKPDIDL